MKRSNHPPNCNCASCRSHRHEFTENMKSSKGRCGGWNRGLTKETSNGVRMQSEKLRGRNHSAEHNRKVSESKTGKPRPDMRGENNPAKRPEVRQKLSGENNPAKRPEVRRYLSEHNPMKDPENVRRCLQSNNRGKTSLEFFIETILLSIHPGEWKFVGNGQFCVAGKYPDFVHVSKPLLIEAFGDYWHSQAVTGASEEQHEKERIELFRLSGYETLVVWEHEIFDQWRLMQKLDHFIVLGRKDEDLYR